MMLTKNGDTFNQNLPNISGKLNKKRLHCFELLLTRLC